MTTLEYLLFVLSIIITTLGLVALGSILKEVFSSRKRTKFRKKLFFFPLFVIGIFAVGWLTERLQAGVFSYLKQNAATSLSGLALAITVAWVLYDYVFWRR